MIVISKTPLRISFSGGGTDLPSFYQQNNYGAVISSSIDSYIYVIVKKHSSLFNEKIRLNYSSVELVNDLEQVKNPIIRECLKFLNISDNIYITTVADCPGASGLGSSSSFCVGLLNALYKYKGISTSIGRLAEEAAHIEINILRRPMGKQDHYAAAYGGLNYFRFDADGSVTIRPISNSGKIIEMIFENMISFWTKMTRPSEKVLTEQNQKSQTNQETLIKMREQADLLLKNISNNSITMHRFGTMIHEGWEMKRSLASQISNTLIDECYAIAYNKGAYGGKISGAGGGGFLNIFAKKNDHQLIIKELLSQYDLVRYKFNHDSLGTTATIID